MALSSYGIGVHGRLADLCKPINRKYNQAISVAGGKHMDCVVRDYALCPCALLLKVLMCSDVYVLHAGGGEQGGGAGVHPLLA